MNRNILLLILLLFLIGPSQAAHISLQVIEEDGHPVDTIFVGQSGYVYLITTIDEIDSIEAVILSFSISSNAGQNSIIEPIGHSDWEWQNSFSQFDTLGFNASYQDGVMPDSGVMFSVNFQQTPAPASDSIIARFRITPTATGELYFDTLTILNGIVQNRTSLLLTQTDYIDVEGDLSFSFNSVVIADCPTSVISCQADTTIRLDAPSEICIPINTSGAYQYSINGATFNNDTICFTIDENHIYPIELIAANSCNADTCTFSVTGLMGCCVGITGDINYGGEELPDISDLLYLVDYMFLPPGAAPAPPCMDEADVDGSGGELPDISDLLYLVDYMFLPPGAAPAPVECYVGLINFMGDR